MYVLHRFLHMLKLMQYTSYSITSIRKVVHQNSDWSIETHSKLKIITLLFDWPISMQICNCRVSGKSGRDSPSGILLQTKKKLNPIRRNCNFVLCCVQFSHTCMGKNIVVWTSIQFCSLELATKSQEEFHFRSPFFQYVCIDFPRRCILVTIWTMFSRYNLDSKKNCCTLEIEFSMFFFFWWHKRLTFLGKICFKNIPKSW